MLPDRGLAQASALLQLVFSPFGGSFVRQYTFDML